MNREKMLKAKEHPLVIAYEEATGKQAIYKQSSVLKRYEPELAKKYQKWSYDSEYVEWIQEKVMDNRKKENEES